MRKHQSGVRESACYGVGSGPSGGAKRCFMLPCCLSFLIAARSSLLLNDSAALASCCGSDAGRHTATLAHGHRQRRSARLLSLAGCSLSAQRQQQQPADNGFHLDGRMPSFRRAARCCLRPVASPGDSWQLPGISLPATRLIVGNRLQSSSSSSSSSSSPPSKRRRHRRPPRPPRRLHLPLRSSSSSSSPQYWRTDRIVQHIAEQHAAAADDKDGDSTKKVRPDSATCSSRIPAAAFPSPPSHRRLSLFLSLLRRRRILWWFVWPARCSAAWCL